MQELLEKALDSCRRHAADEPFAFETVAQLIRTFAGNFRLLTRILTQIEPVLE
jgi:hypothetical protein